MADEKITIDLLINSANSAQTLGEVKKSIKDITKELQNTAVGTAEYNKLAIALGKSKAEFMDFKQQIKAFDPDAKFGAFAKIGSGIAGSFQAATGAMALFGVESEEVQKTLLKVQAATALAQGIKEVEGLKDAFVNFNAVVKANPILFIASALIAIGGILAGIVVSATDWRTEEEKSLDAATDRLNIEKEELTTLEGQTNQLKLSGKTEREILQTKIKQTDEIITAQEQQLLTQKEVALQQIKTAERNKKILSGILDFVTFPLQAIIDGVDYVYESLTGNKLIDVNISESIAKQFFDPEEMILESEKTFKESELALEKLKEQRAGFQLAVQQIDKTAQDKLDKQAEEYFKNLKDKYKDFQEFAINNSKKTNDEILAYNGLTIEQLTEQEEEANKKKLALQNELHTSKVALETDVLTTLKDLNDAFGGQNEKTAKRAFEVSKALSIAQTIISTIEGAQNAFKTAAGSPLTKVFPAYPFIQSALAYAKGLAAVQKIRNQKFGGGSLGGDSGGGNGGGGQGGNGVPLNPVTNNSTLLNPDGTPVNNNPNKNPVKAYVVETEITQSQNKIKSIENKSKFE